MLISIVTVVYNGETYIRRTIESVLCQDFIDYEYIIVDGQSTDNTVTIAKEYEELFEGRMQIYSEKDKGIYDAMNKGIALATGEWIIFMNVGDGFYNQHVIAELVHRKVFNVSDLVYGDTIARYNIGNRLLKAGNLHNITKTMQFSHQSLFVKTTLLKEKMFSSEYKLAADYDFILSTYLAGYKFQYIPIPIAIIAADEGATYANFIRSKNEVYRIHRKNKFGIFRSIYYYYYYCMRFYTSRYIKQLIPIKLRKKITNIE